MQIVINHQHEKHSPTSFISSGKVIDSPETPERAARFIAAVAKGDHEEIAAVDQGMGPIADIHSVDYLQFLQHGYQEWQALPNPPKEMIPNVHPGRHMSGYADHIIAKAGYHMADTACPISEGTWEAAYAGAQTVLTAADLIAAGSRAAYAMCRPPGHHAYGDQAGGFCYLNNVALAAERLRKNMARIAILDVDVHHGNGTQGIFYERADVLFVSLHGDPNGFYPFFSGYSNERGSGPGEGYNRNYPLPAGAGDNEFLSSLADALDAIDSYSPDALLVSLGLDAQENDPLGIFKVTTDGFAQIGAAIGARNYPTLVVQEGGYLCAELADNLVGFLDGFESNHD